MLDKQLIELNKKLQTKYIDILNGYRIKPYQLRAASSPFGLSVRILWEEGISKQLLNAYNKNVEKEVRLSDCFNEDNNLKTIDIWFTSAKKFGLFGYKPTIIPLAENRFVFFYSGHYVTLKRTNKLSGRYMKMCHSIEEVLELLMNEAKKFIGRGPEPEPHVKQYKGFTITTYQPFGSPIK